MMKLGSCETPLPSQNNVFLESSYPFSLTASNTVLAGYKQEFCFRCDIDHEGLP